MGHASARLHCAVHCYHCFHCCSLFLVEKKVSGFYLLFLNGFLIGQIAYRRGLVLECCLVGGRWVEFAEWAMLVPDCIVLCIAITAFIAVHCFL
jgi:hypothetical protein